MNLPVTNDNSDRGDVVQSRQHQLIRRTQRRLNKLMQVMMRRQMRSPGLMPSSDDFEDFMSRSFEQMFTRGLDLDRAEREVTTTTAAPPAAVHRMVPGVPMTVHKAPEMVNDAPRIEHGASQTAPDVPQMAREAPEMVHEDTQTVDGAHQTGHDGPQMVHGASRTVNEALQPVDEDPQIAEVPQESGICIDIRGRDRVCCNTALQCFDGLKTTLDKLETASNDFSLASACRVVNSELRKDKRCVQQSVSRCGGPGRLVLHTRFDNRIDNLYDQFYSHCKRNPATIKTTREPKETTTLLPPPPIPSPTVMTQRPDVTRDTGGQWQTTVATGGKTNFSGGSDVEVGNGLIIAGVITGGLFLTIVLLLAVCCWCRKRKDSNNSDGSRWVFFQNRPKMFSTERSRPTNNNNKVLVREDSSIYAEIDESIVNPNYKPPSPPNVSYISPIGDDDAILPMNQSSSPGMPAITTRGQMSYGPILAANNNNNNSRLFYHSVSVASPGGATNNPETSGVLGPKLPTRGYSSLAKAHLRSDDNSYVIDDAIDYDSLEHDDYEEPISAQSSIQYTQLDKCEPPKEQAPGVPIAEQAKPKPDTAPKPNIQPKNAVKVLPSNPLSPMTTNQAAEPHPVAQPRRKGNGGAMAGPLQSALNQRKEVTSDVLSNRDSSLSSNSTKSSHHYFVLEKNQEMDYENSVSASKLV